MLSPAALAFRNGLSASGAACFESALQRLAPPPDLSTQEWAEKRRQLSAKESFRPGPMSFDICPYIPGILAAVDDPAVREIHVQKSAQVMFTQGVTMNAVGARMDVRPENMVLLFPRAKSFKDFRKEKLVPMIKSTPALDEKIDLKSRSAGNTQDFIDFTGGFLKFVGSNAPADLTSTSASFLAVEEPDQCNVDVKGQGNSIDLLRERAKTFENSKLLVGGTPTVKGLSSTEKAMLETDQRRFYVPCHDCHEAAPLDWANVQWIKDETTPDAHYGKHHPHTAVYACPSCGSAWDDRQRCENIANAEAAGHGWKATQSFTDKAGFYLNELYSFLPASRLEKLVQKYVVAKREQKQGKNEKITAFYNNTLGLAFAEDNDLPEVEVLKERALSYQPLTVPAAASMLVAFMDVQRNRLALLIQAIGPGEESWVIYADEIMGNVYEEAVWDRAAKIISQPFTHASGAEIYVRRVGVDSGDGGTSDVVYSQVRKRLNQGWIATKGSSDNQKEIYSHARTLTDVTPTGKAAKHGLKVHIIGVSKAKALFYSRLKLEGSGPGRVHWFQGIREDYCEQITSEVFSGGKWKVKQGIRNEFLDCNVGCIYLGRMLRAHLMTPLEWQALADHVRQGDLFSRSAEKTTVRLPQRNPTKPAPTNPARNKAPNNKRKGFGSNEWNSRF